jgi:glycosyltransferase involved in cell wall biosynthesis
MNDKITCMCITHNRVHLLERSMNCYKNQTFDNRELIVLHTNDDTQTAQFSLENNHRYNRIKLTNLNNTKGLLIQSIEDPEKYFEDFEQGERVSLKTQEGTFLSFKGKVLSSSESLTATEEMIFFREKDQICIQINDKTFLKATDDFTYSVANEIFHFKAIILVDTSAKLIPYHLTEGEATLQEEGWLVEHLNNVESDITIIEVHSDPPISLGSKRNLVLKLAKGTHVCIWDDDDWYDNNRLSYQYGFAEFMQKPASSLISVFLYDHHTHKGYHAHPREEGWEPSLLCKKSEFGWYSNLNKREDTPVLKRLFEEEKLAVLDDPMLYIYNIHTGRGNTCSSEHFLKIVNSSRTSDATMEEVEYVRNSVGITVESI